MVALLRHDTGAWGDEPFSQHPFPFQLSTWPLLGEEEFCKEQMKQWLVERKERLHCTGVCSEGNRPNPRS
jgi:hypothetical protein